MKTIKNVSRLFYLLVSIFIISSCSKERSISNSSGASSAAISATSAIAVGVSSSTNDSIYVIGTCDHGNHLDSVSTSSLPSSITQYLDSNYSGYSFQKAFAEKDSSGIVTAYVVIINFNGNPVGLKFDASGNFVKVLEQREGHDLEGKGWHDGGRFCDRDGRGRDSLSLASLPSGITNYFTTNYPQDTLLKAFRSFDSSYIVISKNNGIFATAFSSDGTFTARVQLEPNHPQFNPLSQADLPSAITTYLDSTYPGYVFEQAFSFSNNGSIQGYEVGINANGTKYAVLFDASGTFIKAIVIK